MGLFPDFHRNGIIEKSLNSTLISLLPKVTGANDIKRFRPISLVERVYKILAQVLTREKCWSQSPCFHCNMHLLLPTSASTRISNQNIQEFFTSSILKRVLIMFLGTAPWPFLKNGFSQQVAKMGILLHFYYSLFSLDQW